LEIPPLRERRQDIPLLVEHFLRKHAARVAKRIEGVDEGVMDALQAHDWPGNVRELENAIERAVVLSTGPVISRRLFPFTTPPGPGIPARGRLANAGSGASDAALAEPGAPVLPGLKLRENLDWAERETVVRALARAGGVKKDAAEAMGISQRALSYYLSKHRIE
jgi:DNA-binding NtrC family response regulator